MACWPSSSRDCCSACPAGAIADRFDRRRIVAGVDLARAVVLAVLAATIVSGAVSIAIVLLALFILGTAEIFADVSSSSLVPWVVPRVDLGIANARLTGSFLLSNQLVGPPIGAFLFTVGMALPFAANAACFALGAVLVTRVATDVADLAAERAVERGSLRTEMAEGIRWLIAHPPMRTLALTIVAFNVTYGAAWSVLVLYASERLGMSAVGFGLIATAIAIGGIVGTSAYGRLERRFSLADIMRVGLLIETFTHLVARAHDVTRGRARHDGRVRRPRIRVGHDLHGGPPARGAGRAAGPRDRRLHGRGDRRHRDRHADRRPAGPRVRHHCAVLVRVHRLGHPRRRCCGASSTTSSMPARSSRHVEDRHPMRGRRGGAATLDNPVGRRYGGTCPCPFHCAE